ncbi:replication factor C subunit 1 [Sparganum proliferum]
MSKRKRCVIFSDSDSEHEFDSKPIPPPRKHSRHLPDMEEDNAKKHPNDDESAPGHQTGSPRKDKKRKKHRPVFEEEHQSDSESQSASSKHSRHSAGREKAKRHQNDEEPPNHHPRRKKKEEKHRSIFEEGDVDTEIDAPRGKVQLTFEESMRIAQEKKKSKEKESKPVKTLEHFFSAMASPSSKAAPKKVEVSVEDFFDTSSSSKPVAARTPTKTVPVTLVAETPIKEEPVLTSPTREQKHKQHSRSSPGASASVTAQNSRLPSSPTGHAKKGLRGEEVGRVAKSPREGTGKTSEQEAEWKGRTHLGSPGGVRQKLMTPPTSPTSATKGAHSAGVDGSPNSTKENLPVSPSKVTPKKPPPTSGKNPPSTGGSRKAFWAFQAREGPQALGSREIPKGTSSCFKNLTFVITGVLDCIERDDASALIERGGGRCTKSVSKKTTYLIVGRDSGVTKLDKATSLGVKQLTEDQFFDMVYAGFGKSKVNLQSADDDFIAGGTFPDLLSVSATVSRSHLTPSLKLKSPQKSTPPAAPDAVAATSPRVLTDRPVVLKPREKVESQPPPPQQQQQRPGTLLNELWVEKYRPKLRRQLVGQNGPASPANRLFNWLSSWREDYAAGHKAKGYSSAPPWAAGNSSDNGSWARAALLSGPPGIGKTTTAMVVCAELSLSTIELNASDTRSKRSLQEEVSEALAMRSLATMLTSKDQASQLSSHVLIMDEVDGMAGSEDRGGMQELIAVIKTSRVPIICLCNDRQSPKVRSLANYCLDLRFHRPRVEQIKAAVLSLACRESVTIGQQVLEEIIASSNQDMRQVINSVQMWCTDGKAVDKEISMGAAGAQKNLRLGPFETIRKVFSPDIGGGGARKTTPASFADSLDLFFQDYSLGPLFVQENYVNVRPLNAKGDPYVTMDLLAKASEDIATGDIVGRIIQSSSAWSLLPVQGVFACLLPGRLLRGPLPGGPGGTSFPTWFGRNSTQGKNARLLSELSTHLRLSTHGGASDGRSIMLDYVNPLAFHMTAPLKEGDIDSVLGTLNAYQLLREDMDNILELASWKGRPNPLKAVNSKVKAALTRAYNKSSHVVPYACASQAGSSKRRQTTALEAAAYVDEEADAQALMATDSDAESDNDVVEAQSMARKTSKASSSAVTSKEAKPRQKKTSSASSKAASSSAPAAATDAAKPPARKRAKKQPSD